DQEEALAMADRVAVMNEGRALQIDRPRQIYEEPRSRFVAAFIGASGFLSGQVESISDGDTRVRLPDSSAVRVGRVPGPISQGAKATVMVRPEAVRILLNGDAPADGDNVVPATITE